MLVPGGGHLPSPPLHCDSALCPDRHAQLSGLEAHRTLDLGGALPETGPLPRASVFAESQMSGSRQRKVCRELALGNSRPSAKAYLPRARPSAKNSSRQPGPLPRVRPSAKKGRRQPVTAGKRPSPAVCFAEGQNLALGKELLCRVSFLCPRQNIFFLLPNFFPGFTVVP